MSLDDLTPREREILKALSEGATNQAMAEILNISLHTVRSHLRSIRRKLGFYAPETTAEKINIRVLMATWYLLNEPEGDIAPPD